MEQEDREPEIKVTDRRRFSSEGDPVEGAEEEAASPAPETVEHVREAPPLPPPTFEFLVISLRWQAEMQLGLYGGAEEGGPAGDLDAARHTIDLMGMLQQKTKGNLSLEEQRLLDNSLTELRFRFVQASEKRDKKTS